MENQAMSCALVVQKKGALELAVGGSNSSSMGMEVWADRVVLEPAEACRIKKQNGAYSGLSSASAFRKAKKTMALRSQSSEDKENVDPRGPSNRRTISTPSWHPRYPLQDITALMHSSMGMQLNNGNAMAPSSGRSDFMEARKGRPALPVSSINNNSSHALRMKYR